MCLTQTSTILASRAINKSPPPPPHPPPPPSNVGIRFSCDVIRRSSQFILLIGEYITSFTSACIIPDEKRSSLHCGLLQLILPLHPLNAPAATVRTDPAPGFQALARDHSLIEFNISLDLGQSKNINKNPIAEKAVQELEKEILKQDPSGDPISSVSLACDVSCLNTRIRNRGLSAHEIWFQREQFTNIQLYTPDDHLITSQHSKRLDSHKVEQKKSLRRIPPKPFLQSGDIVYLRSDKSKTQARSRYLVVSVDDVYCHVRKFTESQLRRNISKVRLSDCFVVSQDHNLTDSAYINERLQSYNSDSSSEDEVFSTENSTGIIPLPPVPPEISSTPSSLVDLHNDRLNDEPVIVTNNDKRERRKLCWLADYVH